MRGGRLLARAAVRWTDNPGLQRQEKRMSCPGGDAENVSGAPATSPELTSGSGFSYEDGVVATFLAA